MRAGAGNGRWGRRSAWHAVVGGGLLLASRASAAGPEWLAWDPAPECPDAAYIEARVEEWLSGELPAKEQLSVATTLSWDGKGWVVEVEVSSFGQSGRRRVAVADCNDAADFVALTVVLAVDPSLAGTLELPAGATQEDRSGQRQNEQDPDPPAQEQQPSAGDVASTEPRPARSVPLRPNLSLGVEGAAGILPEPTGGLNLAAGLAWSRVSLHLGARWLVPRSTLPPASAAPIEFSLLAARLVAGYSLLGPRVHFGPTLAVEGGMILTAQSGMAPRRESVPWLGLGFGGEGKFELSRRIDLYLQAEVSVPLTQATFVLSNGQEFHQVELGGRGELGVRFFWSDR